MTSSKNRRHGSWFYVQSVLGKVWRHPGNRGRRLRACARALTWQTYKRVVRRPLTIRAYGQMRVWCYPDSTAASDLIYFGPLYEHAEMSFLQRYLRPSDTAIDGGANIGTFTLFLASCVGHTGRVVAIEPDPVAAQRLHENVNLNRLNRRVDIVEAALAQREGSATLSTGWDVANHLISGSGSDRGVNVQTTTLDRLCADLGEIAFVKLDLEGGEHHALLGGSLLLERGGVAVWMIEGIEWRIREAGGSRAQMLQMLADSGYTFATYSPASNRLTRLETSEVTDVNFFAVSEDRWHEVDERLVSAAAMSS